MSSMTTSSPMSSLLPYPLDDARCNSSSCAAYAAGKKASQAAESWASQFLYGHWVVEAWCILLGLVSLWLWSQRLAIYLNRNSPVLDINFQPRYKLTTSRNQESLQYFRSSSPQTDHGLTVDPRARPASSLGQQSPMVSLPPSL